MRNFVLTAALLLVAALVVPISAEPDAGASANILVCDLARVVEECIEGKELIATERQKANATSKTLEERLRKVNDQKAALQAGRKLSERDADWYAALEKTAREEMEIKIQVDLLERRAADLIARKLNQLMLGARGIADKIMRERGGEIVIISKTGPIRLESDKELREEYVFRRVLCARKGVDITEKVLEKMNEWYEQNKRDQGQVPERKAG